PIGSLTPLGGAATLTPSQPLAPLGATNTLSPLGATEGLTPYGPLGKSKAPSPPARKARKAQNYTLIYILATALGIVCIAAIPLGMWFMYGKSANLYQRAEDEYKNGALSAAIDSYNKFLEGNPSSKDASRARVKRDMAEIRQASGEGKNPRAGLTKMQALLPEMETEEAFDDIRVDLRTILVEIARSFATQAVATKETAKREEVVARAE